MLTKTSTVIQLVRTANDLESLGFYDEASKLDSMIKEAGILSNLWTRAKPLWPYIQNLGKQRVVDYVQQNPDSWIAKFVRTIMNRPDTPTAPEVQDLVDTISAGKAEEDKRMVPVVTPEKPVEETPTVPTIPGVMTPEVVQGDEPIINTLKSAVMQAPAKLRFTYRREEDGATGNYDVMVRAADSLRDFHHNRAFATGEYYLYAEHDGDVHSFRVKNISSLQRLT